MGQVYCLAWKTAYADLLPRAFLENLTQENCEPPKEKIEKSGALVFEENGKILGLAHFGKSRDGEDVQELYALYVLPEEWRKGVGKALFQAAGKEMGEAFFLWTMKDNTRARRFYEKMGMALTGNERRISIGGTDISEVQYRI